MASVKIIPEKSLEQDTDDVTVLVKVETPNGESRSPVDICCVIDISGSMGNHATIQNAQGQTESHGLTQLDVAKHGVRTVIKTLGPKDRLCVVAFDNNVDLILDLTLMDEEGQQKAENELDKLDDRGGTDIWLGLEKGLDVLRMGGEVGGNRLAHTMLLTDGQTMRAPTVIPNLEAYKSKYERLPCTLSTFGFGYNIDSPMLVKIADSGSGTYSFIPDAGFVGTVFVNTMSNLLVTFATDVFLNLQTEGDSKMSPDIPGNFQKMESEGRLRVRLGTLQYGQSRDILVKMDIKTSDDCYLVARLQYGDKDEGELAEAGPKNTPNATEVMTHKYRLQFVDITTAALSNQNLQEAERKVSEFAQTVENSELKDRTPVKELLEDIAGQTLAAFSRADWMNKWGRHYVPSLMFAHKLQMCNNFKDPGVQVYGGSLFEKIQTEADDTFNKLPAPSPKERSGYGYGHASAAAAAPVSMAAYNDRYAGCIDGDCPVQMADGEVRSVCDLKQGDFIASSDGGSAEIICVVRSECLVKRAELVEVSKGTRLTPFHPVKVGGTWQFPQQLAEPQEVECEAIYSFVLSGSPSLLVGGIPCIGLGHGVNEGAAAHPYFSSPKVLEDLSVLPGFTQGLVQLQPSWVVRDANMGHVIGFKFNGQ